MASSFLSNFKNFISMKVLVPLVGLRNRNKRVNNFDLSYLCHILLNNLFPNFSLEMMELNVLKVYFLKLAKL